jgi:hypothetical protein
MKIPLLPALIALAVCVLAGGARAEAQRPEGVVAIDPATTAARSADPSFALVGADLSMATTSPVVSLGPRLVAPTSVTRGPDAGAPTLDVVARPLAQSGGIRMPTSRVLMIGGAAAAITGLLVGGDAGAIVAVTGTAAAIYGLYLHYR